MNDPQLDGPVEEAAEANERNPYEDQFEDAAQEDQEFLDPRCELTVLGRSYGFHLTFFSRWWFASTACPLLAGTFGPIANGLSICALVENWRVYIPPGSSEGYGVNIRDPAW